LVRQSRLPAENGRPLRSRGFDLAHERSRVWENAGYMVRPCFLVVDREYPGSISTRKLVIETAKLNVLTAYSADEALKMLETFPAVSGVVIDVGTEGMSSGELVHGLKKLQPKLPVIVISAPGFEECPEADYNLESFMPAKLLELLKQIQPEAAREIELRNEQLSREQGST